MGERAIDGDDAGQCRLAAEGGDVGKLEKRVDVESGEFEAGLGLIVRFERRETMHGQLGGIQPRGHVVREGMVGGVRDEL